MSGVPEEFVAGIRVPQYIALKQAAALCGMSVPMLRLRVRRGEGPRFHRRGRQILFLREDFIEWAARDVIP